PAFLFDCGHSGQDRFVQAELLDDGYRCGLGTGAQNRIVLGDFQLAAAGQMSPGLQRDEGGSLRCIRSVRRHFIRAVVFLAAPTSCNNCNFASAHERQQRPVFMEHLKASKWFVAYKSSPKPPGEVPARVNTIDDVGCHDGMP
ncbi:hypothetical protein KUCAC02_020600, partial [Chaenocephalus aceratus]